jgi:transcriptional regulator with XRE-family HTH domain
MPQPGQPSASRRAEFGAWFRERRKSLGKSQEALAEDVEMSRISILRIENGHSGTTEENLPKLAEALNVSLSEIERRYYGDRVKVKPDEELTLIVRRIPKEKQPAFVDAIRHLASIY